MDVFSFKKLLPILLLAGCAASTNVPPNPETSSLPCNKDDCVGVGFYNIATQSLSTEMAYASYTQNFGETWLLGTQPPLAENTKLTHLIKISCNTDKCVAVGQAVGSTGDRSIQPYSVLSDDHGKTWNTPTIPPIPTGRTNGFLLGLNCSGDHCVAGGTAGNPNDPKQYTYTVISNDHGKTWSTPLSPPLPDGSAGGGITTITCNQTNCIALGSTKSADLNPINKPYSVLSNDGGKSWDTPLSPPLPSDGISGVIFSITCKDTKNCIAVGAYEDNSSLLTKPYSVLTNDYGKTWNTPVSPTLPEGGNSGLIASITCTKDDCVAVGYYINETAESLSYSVLSNDYGKTWHNPFSPPLPTDMVAGILDAVNCNEKKCLAIGTTFSMDSKKRAYSVSSTDGGTTWQTPNIAPLPSGATQNCFGFNGCAAH